MAINIISSFSHYFPTSVIIIIVVCYEFGVCIYDDSIYLVLSVILDNKSKNDTYY